MLALWEPCVICGYTHRVLDWRDSRKRHYHWGPEETEVILQLVGRDGSFKPIRIHRTCCARHLSNVPWEANRALIEPRFVVPGSLNAPLLTGYSPAEMAELESRYESLCRWLRFRAHTVKGGEAMNINKAVQQLSAAGYSLPDRGDRWPAYSGR